MAVLRDLVVDGRLVGRLRLEAKDGHALTDWCAQFPSSCTGGFLISDIGTARAGEADLELSEDGEYAFEITCAEPLELGPTEVWDVIGADRRRGRLRPGRYVGTMRLVVVLDDGGTVRVPVEVASRKLGYRRDYRSMVGQVSDRLVDLALRAFAPAQLVALTHDPTGRPPASLYQAFASLQAVLDRPRVSAALAQVVRDPDRRYAERRDHRPIDRARPSSVWARDLAQGGAAATIPIGALDLPVPHRIPSRWFEEDFDTPANRFVRHVLQEWRSVAVDVVHALEPRSDGSAARGRLEAAAVIRRLDELLAAPVIATAGPVTTAQVPHQILQNKAGYRELYAAWLTAASVATLNWEADERTAAGARDVALLYETWCFLELLALLEQLSGKAPDQHGVIGGDGKLLLDLHLAHGAHAKMHVVENGVTLEVTLYYNRRYPRSGVASWSIPMQPDISLEIVPLIDREARVAVHFDAKYRVDGLAAAWRETNEVYLDATASSDPLRAKRDDLLKMHAYRDAIRRSVGSYVLFPGNAEGEPPLFEMHKEVVPGVGAFSFRPSADGSARPEDRSGVTTFIKDVMQHVATRTTRRARADYWNREAYSTTPASAQSVDEVLRRPPADVVVLLGLTRDMSWTERTRSYLLRANADRDGSVGVDGEELRPHLVLVYGGSAVKVAVPAGPVHVVDGDWLRKRGYHPGGSSYFVLDLTGLVDAPRWLTAAVQRVTPTISPRGRPHLVRLAELV